jgi:hypothetical protein
MSMSLTVLRRTVISAVFLLGSLNVGLYAWECPIDCGVGDRIDSDSQVCSAGSCGTAICESGGTGSGCDESNNQLVSNCTHGGAIPSCGEQAR